MSVHIKKAIPVLTTVIVLWAVLAFAQRAFLYKNGDLSLFLFDWTFFKESFLIPGGFLGMLGSFFTQFLYIPWFGALLWTILLLITEILIVGILRIPPRLATVATIPVALIIIANMSLGYGIFIMRSQDYFFAPVIGYIFILTIMGATWQTDRTWIRLTILTVSAFAGYCLAGIYALVGVAAAGIGLAVSAKGWKRYAAPAFSILLCIAAPLILYGLFTTYRLADSWFMGIPSVNSKPWTAAMRLPYWFLFGTTIVLASLRGLFVKARSGKQVPVAVHIGIVAISICATVLFWFKDPNFKTELEMSIAADQYDWQAVTDIFKEASLKDIEKEKKTFLKMKEELNGATDEYSYNLVISKYEDCFFEPTRLMVVLRDLALLKQNKALDTAFSYRDGNKPQQSRGSIPVTIQAGPQIYLDYGIANLAYRWCLENHVQFGWSFSTLKYMAMHAVLMNETEFAAKFLDKLDKTLFYRKWSRSQRPLSHDAKAMSQSLPYKEILPYMCFDDRMSVMDGGDFELYLMHHFFEDRDSQATPEFDRAALLWAMNSKNTDMFWKAFAQYAGTSTDSKLPKHVQEITLLFNSLDKEDMGIPFDKEVLDVYANFQKSMQQNPYRSEYEASFPLWQKFGRTYYYYYYFKHNLYSF